MKPFSIKGETAVSVGAAVIALSALVVSIYQGCAQREHDRLSVRPALRLDKMVSQNDKLLGTQLRNAGTGSALVTHFTVYVDDQPMPKEPVDVWENAEKALGLFGRKLPLSEFYYDPGDSIPTDESTYLIGITDEAYEKLSESDQDLVSRALSRIKIQIDYTSVYKEPFSVKYPHR